MQILLKQAGNLIRVIYFFIALFLLGAPLLAQQNKRVEIETQGNADEMIVVPIGDEGLILFSQVAPGKYNFVKYTTDLQQDWAVDCIVNTTLNLSKYVYNGKSLYLLFSRFKSPTYQIVKLNVKAGFAEKFEMRSVNKLEITDFEAIGTNVFIAGKTRSEPILLHLNLQNKQTQVLPTAVKGKAEIQSLELDTVNQQLNVAFATWRGRENKLIIKSFAPNGEQINSVALDSEAEKNLLTGRVSTLQPGQELVLGTYGTRGPSYATGGLTYTRSVYTGSADYTQGLYISKLNNGQPEFMKYYSFTDFKNFFNFMNGRQQERMEKRIKKRKEQGKDLKLQYRLMVHDIIQHNGQYIMVAEAYYPEYRNNNFYAPGMYGYGYGYSMYGNPYGYGRNMPIFDGWVYTHAVIAGFDMQGNLLWDNSFEINDVKTYSLREKVKVSFAQENIVLAYSHKGLLKTKVIRGNDIMEGKEELPLRSDYEGDIVRRSSIDNVDYWYQNNFLAWGYQKIRNQKDEQVKGRRNVFYFSKVGF